jgi:hypothetical protein
MKLIHPPGMPPHPWADGIWIFPEDHPLSKLEQEAYAKRSKSSCKIQAPTNGEIQGPAILPKALPPAQVDEG